MLTSIEQYFSHIKINFADRTAFQWYDETGCTVVSRSYRDYISDVRRFICFLQNWLPSQGKHIALLAGNSYHYAVAVFGIICSGNTAVLLNTRESKEHLVEEISYADTDLILTDQDSPIQPFAGTSSESLMYAAIDSYREYEKSVLVFPDNLEHTAFLLYTSGTSGQNKCVMLSIRNLLACAENGAEIFRDFTEGTGRILRNSFMMMPMYHVMGLSILIDLLYSGHCINLCTDPRHMYRDLRLMPSDYACIVPMVLNAWYRDIKTGQSAKLGGIYAVLTAGASMDAAEAEDFTRCGILIVQAYGSTESFGTGAHNLFNRSHKYSSIGKATSPAINISFEHIELCIQSPTVMQGYYKDPTGTAEVLKDGKLHTGDLGTIDEDGYITVTGRKKNLIILSNGENINPEELESRLCECSFIHEALVKEYNDRLTAEIYCEAGNQSAAAIYIDELNRKLPLFKQITRTFYRDTPFRKTGSGKIIRYD